MPPRSSPSAGWARVAPQPAAPSASACLLVPGRASAPGATWRYLVLLETKLAIAVLLGNFDIKEVSTADGREPRELLQLAMGPVGLRLRLQERATAVA